MYNVSENNVLAFIQSLVLPSYYMLATQYKGLLKKRQGVIRECFEIVTYVCHRQLLVNIFTKLAGGQLCQIDHVL